MSDTYSDLIEQLNSEYDLEHLAQLQEQHEANCIKAGRAKVKKAVSEAKSKGGFSNTTVARYLKESVLHELIEAAGDDFNRIMCSDVGERIPEHQEMFKHFIDSCSAMYEYRNGLTPEDKGVDVTQLINLQQWIFIGLNGMLDAAAIPASNDYQIKRRRWEIDPNEKEKVKPHRPSVASIHRNIGTMICFQMRMQMMKSLWWNWFDKQLQEANKKGSAGLRYFQRDMNEAIAGLISHLGIKARSCQQTYEKLKLITSFDELTRGHGTDTFRITLGSWVYGIIFDNLVIDGVPFFSETPSTPTKPKLLEMIKDEHGAPVLTTAWSKTLRHANVLAPMVCPPRKLNAEHKGGRISSQTLSTLKTWKGHTDMAPQRVDFFNRQALTPLKINSWILDLLTTYKEANQSIGSFDYYIRADHIPLPSDLLEGKPNDYDKWEPKQQHRWNTAHPDWKTVRRQSSQIKTAHFHRLREAEPSYVLYDMACSMVEHPAIWLPVRPEFRTRLITDVLHLSYQGRDSAKALLKLAEPVDIGDGKSTRKWIANQLATTYGSNLDKLSMSKRINKVEHKDFQEKIRVVATMLYPEGDWSAGNDILQAVDDGDGKPLQFAAACREWWELFMHSVPKTTTDLIVNNDCSCSGQQFAAGWRRAKGIAIATNAAPSDDPHDLYKDVWDELVQRVTDNGAGFSRRHTVDLRNGKGRGIMKGGIQPNMYGSGEQTALNGVLAKMAKYHKKGLRLSDKEQALIVEYYQQSLDEVCEMNTTNEWFRKLSSALAKKKAPHVVIPTPLGDNIIIKYEKSDSYSVDTFRYGKCQYKTSRRTAQLVKPNGSPDRRKWRTALSANTTHGAGDASMLAIALHDADFHFVTCHDSVGCAAPRMDDLRDRMRKAYVEVAQFPIFEKILEANDITPKQDWPDPIVGDWNPTDALDSEYLLS